MNIMKNEKNSIEMAEETEKIQGNVSKNCGKTLSSKIKKYKAMEETLQKTEKSLQNSSHIKCK